MYERHFFTKKFVSLYLLFFCLAVIALVACSGKGGKIKGILQASTLDGIEAPLAAWETFDYNGTDTCIVNQSNGLTPIALKKGTRVEVVEEATCSQIIFNEETGDSSHFQQVYQKSDFLRQQMWEMQLGDILQV